MKPLGHTGGMGKTLADKMKKIHKDAGGLSARQAARVIGVPETSYAYYQSKKYKKDTIPSDLADRMIDTLVPRGADKEDILAIAGTGPDMPRLRDCLSVMMDINHDAGLNLTPDQLSFLTIELYQFVEGDGDRAQLRGQADILVMQMLASSRV